MARFRGQLGMGEKAQHVETVVHGHDHDAARREPRAVIARLGARAGDVAAAMDPEHDRQPVRSFGRGRRPDIEIEAVLRHAGDGRIDVVPDDSLQRIGPEGVGRAARPSRETTGCGARQRKGPTGGAA